MNASIVLDKSKSINIEFDAQYIIVLNPTGSPIYLRRGGNDIPSAASADIYVPPTTFVAIPITATRNFGAALGTAVVPAQSGAPAILLFYDTPQLFGIASVALPNVAAQSQWKEYDAAINPGVTATILTPPTGKSLNIKRILFSLGLSSIDGSVNDWRFSYDSSAAAYRIIGFQPDVSEKPGLLREFDFTPDGITLPVGKPLLLTNGDVTVNAYVWILVIYTTV